MYPLFILYFSPVLLTFFVRFHFFSVWIFYFCWTATAWQSKCAQSVNNGRYSSQDARLLICLWAKKHFRAAQHLFRTSIKLLELFGRMSKLLCLNKEKNGYPNTSVCPERNVWLHVPLFPSKRHSSFQSPEPSPGLQDKPDSLGLNVTQGVSPNKDGGGWEQEGREHGEQGNAEGDKREGK